MVETFELDGNGQASEDLEHDAAGNLVYDGVFQYTYDAWNRMVAATKAYRDSDTNELELGSRVQENIYDGMGRRIVQRVLHSADMNGTYHYYYESQSVVEVRNGSDQVLKQHVWASLAGGYIDELVQVSLNSEPALDDEADVPHWALHDNSNVLGIVDAAGVLVERYEYTPYGQREVYFSARPNDSMVMSPTRHSRRWETWGGASAYGLNSVGHQGLMHDEVTGLVQNRIRMLHPNLGRFMQRDPLGYVDGMSLYQYQISSPVNWLDSLGLVLDERWMDRAVQRASTPLNQRDRNGHNTRQMMERAQDPCRPQYASDMLRDAVDTLAGGSDAAQRGLKAGLTNYGNRLGLVDDCDRDQAFEDAGLKDAGWEKTSGTALAISGLAMMARGMGQMALNAARNSPGMAAS